MDLSMDGKIHKDKIDKENDLIKYFFMQKYLTSHSEDDSMCL